MKTTHELILDAALRLLIEGRFQHIPPRLDQLREAARDLNSVLRRLEKAKKARAA